MLYVIAGNHQQYLGYLRARNRSPQDRDVQYVSSPERLMGIQLGSHAVTTGTYNERSDWSDIKERLMICQADVRYDPY
jgi:hypothetical protein